MLPIQFALFLILLHNSPSNTILTQKTLAADSMNTPNTQLTQINKLAQYNHWANQEFIQWLEQADSAQWIRFVESSFSSLELTVRHLWNAESGWLSTLQKEPWKVAVDKESTLSQSEVLQGFRKTSEDFLNFVESMTVSQLLETRNIGKNEKPISLADIIQHVYNHATFHRGQLVTIGRQTGMKNPPRTDYIYYMTR